MSDPTAATAPGSPALRDLVRGWGNRGFSAKEEYLAHCMRHALATDGPILECGSGLSTIVIGAVAKRRGVRHWALEHTAEWGARTQRDLDRYRLDTALRVAPLRDHGEFAWYDAPLASMPEQFALVVCDGPPGQTKGGRYGLVPIMRDRLAPGCVIMLDDAAREEDVSIARRWQAELRASLRILGEQKPYIEMHLPCGAIALPLVVASQHTGQYRVTDLLLIVAVVAMSTLLLALVAGAFRMRVLRWCRCFGHRLGDLP